ncbi:MAG: type II secretion system protein GspC [Myxococcota bacterium]
MEVLLKRHFWLINLLGLGIIAWLTAGSMNSFVGMYLTKLGRSEARPMVAAESDSDGVSQRLRDGRLRDESGAVIAGRSIFLIEEPLPEEPPPEEGAEAADEGPLVPTYEPTTLPVKLLGTMVVSPETWSSASLEVEKGEQKIVNVGVELLGGQATVYAIRRNYIVLQEGAKLTIAPLFGKDPGGAAGIPTASVAPSPMPQRPLPSPTAGPNVEGVRRVSDTAWQLDRNNLNDKLKDLSKFSAEVRVVPNYRNGKQEGVRMVGMAGNSLIKNIGFENGDLLMAVNGERIDNPNKALALYEALKNKSRLTVLIDRGGVAKTLRYTIR